MTSWSVIVSSAKIGRGGLSLSPGAAQCTCRRSGVVGIVPCSSTISPRSMRSTCPSRTTSSIRRSCSSSPRLTVPPFIIVGVTLWSVRSTTSSCSSRSYTPSTESDATIASSWRTTAANVRAPPGLEERPVQDPGVAWTDPGDVVGIVASIEEPADGIQRGLAPTDDHVASGGMVERGQVADRDTPCSVCDFERLQDQSQARATPCRSRRRLGVGRSLRSIDR